MNLASRDYQEKRNYIRMKVDTPVRIALGGRAFNGVCHNLSGGGLFISAEEAVPMGAELEVAVTSSHGHNPMLKARARVSRILSAPDSKGKPCYAGLEILDIIE